MDQIYADAIVDVIVNTIVQQRCADVFDLRNIQSSQFNADTKVSSVGMVLRLHSSIPERHFSVTLGNNLNGKVLWTRWYSDTTHKNRQTVQQHLQNIASEVANSVHDQIIAHCKTDSGNDLLSAVHHVLSHSRAGQTKARLWLKDMAVDSGVARAWLMYTYAVAHAERHGGLGPEALEELQEHCVLANAAEPCNPIVQAIVGHINAFVFRRLEQANRHHEIARKLGWNQPIVWTLSAMHANYANRPDKAYTYSSRAMAQSSFSPYRFYYEGPHAISCSLTNRHEEAIRLGEQILHAKPGFLAVMRHLAASQILTGRLEEARQTVAHIRSKDQQFITGEIAADDYPLPSLKSIQLIEHALEVADMKRTITHY